VVALGPHGIVKSISIDAGRVHSSPGATIPFAARGWQTCQPQCTRSAIRRLRTARIIRTKSVILSNWLYDSAAAARTKRTCRVRAETGQELVADAALDAHALRVDFEDVCAPLLLAAQHDAKARSSAAILIASPKEWSVTHLKVRQAELDATVKPPRAEQRRVQCVGPSCQLSNRGGRAVVNDYPTRA